MVEAIEEVEQVATFVVPDEANLHRTLNIAWPYRRKRVVKDSDKKGVKALTECEEDLLDEKLVVTGWAWPENSSKRIE